MSDLSFSEALYQVKMGRKIARMNWNGRGMYVVYQQAYPDGIPINSNTAQALGMPEGTICKFRPYLMIKSVDDSLCPWVASQADILADDWCVV